MVSDINWKYPLLKRILLFQSISQAGIWFGFLVLVWIIVGIFNVIAGKDFINPQYCLVAFLGSLPSLYLTMPCVFYIKESDARQVIARIEPVMSRLGYILSSESGRSTGIFESRLPRALKWKENRVVVETSADGVRIEAPKLIVNRIANEVKS